MYNSSFHISSPLSLSLQPHYIKALSRNKTLQQIKRSTLTSARLHLVGDGLALLDGIDRERTLLAVQLVGQLGVVLDVRDADLGVVAVEDAGDFLESGTPVIALLVKDSNV